IALALGLRQGEALGLQWPQVDLTAGTLRVRNALQRRTWQHGCDDPTSAAPSTTRRNPARKTVADTSGPARHRVLLSAPTMHAGVPTARVAVSSSMTSSPALVGAPSRCPREC